MPDLGQPEVDNAGQDPEIRAMSEAWHAIRNISEDGQRRVLNWLYDKVGIPIPTLEPFDGKRPALPAATSSSHSAPNPEPPSQTLDSFEDFGDLLFAIPDVSKQDRALLAGYWIQKQNPTNSFASNAANRLLRDAGFYDDHISETYETLMGARPALVAQLRKGGQTQQARKSYRVTGEGINHIRHMAERH
jgi:hypothetical protein